MASTASVGEYVFRVYHDDSHGSNTLHKFSPAACSTYGDTFHTEQQPESIDDFPGKLTKALAWKDFSEDSDCPITFFTNSPLFAMIYAGWMAVEGKQKIVIACIKVETATTTHGEAVQFHPVNELVDEYGIQLRKCKDGRTYDYPHELVVTTSAIPGDGSCYAKYDDLLKGGLHNLHPVLSAVNDRGRHQLNRAMERVRKFSFREVWALSDYKLNIAARLVHLFLPHPTTTDLCDAETTSTHLFAFFLGLKSRSKTDDALLRWVTRNNNTLYGAVGQMEMSGEIAEIAQYHVILDILGDFDVPHQVPARPSRLDIAAIENEKTKYHAFYFEDRDEYRAVNPYQERKERIRTSKGSRRKPRSSTRAPQERTEANQSGVRKSRVSKQPRKAPSAATATATASRGRKTKSTTSAGSARRTAVALKPRTRARRS